MAKMDDLVLPNSIILSGNITWVQCCTQAAVPNEECDPIDSSVTDMAHTVILSAYV